MEHRQPSESASLNPCVLISIIALAATGGYADALTYLLAGSFTGHITGNTILATIAFATENWHGLTRPVLAIALFLIGTSVGLLLGRFEKRFQILLLAVPLEAILVAIAALSPRFGVGDPKLILLACLCLALGLQNGVFHKVAGVPVHATYVTGDVTSLITAVVQGASVQTPRSSNSIGSGNNVPRISIAPGVAVLAWTWISFSSGALLSGILVRHFGITAMWFLEFPLIVAALAAGIGRHDRASPNSQDTDKEKAWPTPTFNS